MRYLLYFLVSGSILSGVFFVLGQEKSFQIKPMLTQATHDILSVPEGERPAKPETVVLIKKIEDLPNQKPLPNPQLPIKAVYATSWSASSAKKVDYLVDLIKKTELNAVVIDVKDFSGFVTYDIKNPEVEKYGAKEIRIAKINTLIKKLHDENIYAIARITVFQDPILAAKRPDLAIKNKLTGEVWKDRKGLSWLDPAGHETWDYNVGIAKDASSRGFDEINFDYIRFPSDGDLSLFQFPFYDPKTQLKATVIKEFFAYLRSHLEGIKISADLFGLATVNDGDLGIGQVIEDAYANFDYVSPMVYPSHYATGFLGYKNPAAFPYEIVKYSLDHALTKFDALNPKPSTKIRPWFQDFNLGATYDALKVEAQIKAASEAGLSDGWMLWNPSNIYTQDALLPE